MNDEALDLSIESVVLAEPYSGNLDAVIGRAAILRRRRRVARSAAVCLVAVVALVAVGVAAVLPRDRRDSSPFATAPAWFSETLDVGEVAGWRSKTSGEFIVQVADTYLVGSAVRAPVRPGSVGGMLQLGKLLVSGSAVTPIRSGAMSAQVFTVSLPDDADVLEVEPTVQGRFESIAFVEQYDNENRVGVAILVRLDRDESDEDSTVSLSARRSDGSLIGTVFLTPVPVAHSDCATSHETATTLPAKVPKANVTDTPLGATAAAPAAVWPLRALCSTDQPR